VPEIALRWLVEEPERRHRTLDGSMVFADISGFTALSERLAARGRIGAEELVETLSRVFGLMLDAAAARGGQLLKFGGDALLFLFDGDGHEIRAAAAAVDLRRELRRTAEWPTSVGRLKLKMSVGVHSGPIDLFLVGGTHRELVIAGPGATQTLGAEHTAVAGEILVTASTAAALPRTSTTPHDETYHLLRWRQPPETAGELRAPPRTTLDTVSQLLPETLAEVLVDVADPGHRIATIAFVRFSGTDEQIAASADDAATLIDRTITIAQETLAAEGVVLLTVDVDGDGGKLFCATGIPRASEDDEGRMLRAMRALADAETPLPLQIGVNRGHVFAAELGTAWRAAYSAMGDTTNTAARIAAGTPPGKLRAHPDVLVHARRRYESEAVGPFRFKGKTEPLMLYELGHELGRKAETASDELPLRGRDDEMRVMLDALDRAAQGAGGAVTVAGAAGLGKSRLVREALQQRPTIEVVALRAEPNGATTSFRPFRDPWRELFGIKRGTNDVMAASLLARVAELDASLLPFAPLLASVVHIDIGSTREVDEIAARHRPDRTADVVLALLARVRPGPLTILIDDAQWVDEASAHLLGRLATAAGPDGWLVVAIRRDSDEGFAPTVGPRIEMGPLSDDAVRALVLDAVESTPLRPHEIDEIVDRADGNPQFVEEIIRAARQLGSLESMPSSLQAAIAAQVDAAGLPARRALGYASVLGRSFRQQVFVDLLRAERLTVDPATQAELMRFLEPDGDVRYRFRSGLVRDVTYDGLAYRTRARLHRSAGEALERFPLLGPADAGILAHHFVEAGDRERTWKYSIQAADQAQEAYANVDAARHLEHALEAAQHLDHVTDEQRLQRWIELGELRYRAGLLDSALDAYRRAGRLVKGDPVETARLYLLRATTHTRAGSYAVALRETSRARSAVETAVASDAAARAVAADAMVTAAEVRQKQERADATARLAEQIIRDADQASEPASVSALALACNLVSWSQTMLGDPDAEQWARRALELYEELGDLVGQANMANNLGIQAYFDGRWDETLELYRRSMAASERVGNVADAAATAANIGELLVNQGRLDEAEPVLRHAARALRASGYVSGAAFAEMHLGRLLTARGDLTAAEHMLSNVRDQLVTLGRLASAMETALYLAECRVLDGRAEDALLTIELAARLVKDDVSILDATRGRITAAALFAIGRTDQAAAELLSAIDTARRRGLAYELALLLLAAAEMNVVVDATGWSSPHEEAMTLLDELGVVVRPRYLVFQSGSPLPS
jgi:predicted ATPase/class 3 adenylate cyclase